jgi:hypothetical protein
MNPLTVVKPFFKNHEPEILLSMGITGLLFSTIWGIKATVKATKIVMEQPTKPTTKQVIKLTWKLYVPVVLSAAASVPCLIASNRVSSKRYAAVATAYTISETALQEYQEKTKEIVGEKKESQIKEAVSKDTIEKTYQDGKNNIVVTGDGDSLFYEPLSGRYFKSNWNKIAKAANELNKDAISSMSGEVDLNSWYDAIGLPRTSLGDEIGWNLRNGVKSLIDISISSSLTPDNVPCGAISYNNNPDKLDSYN